MKTCASLPAEGDRESWRATLRRLQCAAPCWLSVSVAYLNYGLSARRNRWHIS